MSSSISGRRRSRDGMDAAESPPAISHGPWQGYRRVVTEHQVVVDGQTYTVEEASFEPPSYKAEVERMSRLMHPYLTSRPESHRSCKRARVAASSDATLGLQEAMAGDAGRTPADCAVCLQDFVVEDRLRSMPCSHAFHEDCIFRWLRVNHVCPLCRYALPTQQQDDQDDEGDYLQDQIDAHFRQFYDEEANIIASTMATEIMSRRARRCRRRWMAGCNQIMVECSVEVRLSGSLHESNETELSAAGCCAPSPRDVNVM